VTANEYDYILVGSGVAAATLAKELLERNTATSILMLEAGPVVPAKDRRLWWDYVVQGRRPYAYTYDQPGETRSDGNIFWDFDENRVLAYGGSTMHWGGWCLRFKPEDFELRSRTGEGCDWPFGYETLESFYDQAEEYLSVCGGDDESWNQNRKKPYPLPPFEWTVVDGEMVTAFRKLGIEPGRMPMARYRKCMATGTCKYCPFGARFSAQFILDDLAANPRYTNLQIQTLSPVTRILMGSKSKAIGVEFLHTPTGTIRKAHAAKIVVCAGAYESPKLLLLSNSAQWPNGVGNDHDLVGRHITSHSMLAVRGVKSPNTGCWYQEYDLPTLMSRTYDTPKEQKDGKLFIFKNRAVPSFDFADKMIRGLTRKQIISELTGSREMELQAFLEEKGHPENRLTIGPGKNRWGLPGTVVDFNRSTQETSRAKARLKPMEKVIVQMGYQITKSNVDNPGGHHATGTCRMATTPQVGVVDENLRVHDTENVYVCSNAVFPSESAVNPTLTLTALTMRLAEHLAGRKPAALPTLAHRVRSSSHGSS
jgi:choline dehydrogenase-like flavoprotein